MTESNGAANALAIALAQPDPERYLSITESLRLDRATVIAAGEDLGVLVRLRQRGVYFAAPFSRAAARIMADLIPDGALVSLIDERYLACFTGGAAVDPGRYGLWVLDGTALSCSDDDQVMPAGFSISTLGSDAISDIVAHYELLDRAEIEEHLARGWIRGGFDASGTLVGFIGEHEEASMGMLEVFPAARRHGYAFALEAALIDELLQAGRVPFCHVAPANEASRGLQRKLGLRPVDDMVQCWFEMPQHRPSSER